MKRNFARDILLGLTVGDALGVPVEFRRREAVALNPVRTMIGHGTHNQLPGTWSDDSSLALCLAEAMIEQFTLRAVGDKFVAWYDKAYWTPRGSVFDIGLTTRQAIFDLKTEMRPELAGGFDENSNGNGSLMRILPLALYLKDKPLDERYLWTKNISSLTHAHIRSVIACFIYLEIALHILNGDALKSALEKVRQHVPGYFLTNKEINPDEVNRFHRILNLKVGNYDMQPIEKMKENEISSSGYVVSTLEASIWCLVTTSNYADATLKAVNLGDDTDTTGCVTGGLAGLIYGYDNIPANWIDVLARKEDIKALADKLNDKYL